MNKTEIKRFIAVMEFFYGFLFGVAVFSAALTFLIIPSFFTAVLCAVCVFTFFIFLMAIVRYCIVRIKIAQQTFEMQLESHIFQDKLITTLYPKDSLLEE